MKINFVKFFPLANQTVNPKNLHQQYWTDIFFGSCKMLGENVNQLALRSRSDAKICKQPKHYAFNHYNIL